MKRKFSKQEKGITLIALIITIIILIILAGISINILMGKDGLVAKAKLGAQNYQNAAIEEQELLDDINKRIGEKTEEKIQLTENSISKKVEVGDYVMYNPTKLDSKGKINIDESKLTYTSYANLDKVGVSGSGDFINDGNGGDKGQTFVATNSTKWRVLEKDENTGEVVLISDGNILCDDNNGYGISYAKGYIYAEKELNEICKIFGYGYGANTKLVTNYQIGDEIEGYTTGSITGSGARCINVDDLNKICGLTTESQLKELDEKYGTKPYTHTVYYPTLTTANSQSNVATERTETYTEYSYSGSNYLNTNDVLYSLIFANTTPNGYNDHKKAYYLASRNVGPREDGCNYGVRYVSSRLCQLWRSIGR